MTEQCNRCRFWLDDTADRDPNDPDWGFGLCRRAPPRISEAYVAALMPRPEYGRQSEPEIDTVRMTTVSLFPATSATDWCGNFGAVTTPIMAALVERNALMDRLDSGAAVEGAADLAMKRIGELEKLLLETPAATKDDMITKLLLNAQFNTEGSYLQGEDAAPLVRNAHALLGIGRVSPNVIPDQEKSA